MVVCRVTSTVVPVAALLAAVAAPRPTPAQVVLDGTLGSPGARVGPNYVVPASLGRQQGGNLFHSFSHFNVNRGESVTFTSTPGVAVSNVLARVTGGSPSNVDGLLRVAIPDANFYLINPAGVMFGPEVKLEVGGAFVVATADALRLADGTSFTASAEGPAPVLSSAAPVAFGFLRPNPAGVSVARGADAARGLFAASGKNLSVVAGPVRIEGGKLVAVGGRLNVVSVASAGEVRLDASSDAPPDVSDAPVMGAVELLDGGSLEAPGGGRVVVRAGSLRVDQSKLNANSGDTAGGGVDVEVRGRLDVIHGRISSDNEGAAPAGPIRLRADVVSLDGLSSDGVAPVSADAKLDGRGGDITIDANDVFVAPNAAVTAFVEVGSAARGGDISVRAARELSINGSGADALTGLATETLPSSSGTAGNITISAAVVRLTERAEVTTTTRGAGPAGTLSVTAGEFVIDGRNADTLTGLQARVGFLEGAGATGAGGRVFVRAGSLRLADAGVISASTFGRGNGGSVDVEAGTLALSATDPARFTGIYARTALRDGGGQGGNLTVAAARIEARGPAELSAVSNGSGTAGALDVHAAARLRLRRGASITAAAGFPEPRRFAPDDPPPSNVQVPANAGGLVVTAGRGGIGAFGGSTISARATLDSGSVRLRTRGTVRVVRGTITAEAGRSAGENGVIDIDPPAVVLKRSTINGLAAGRDVPVVIDPRAVFLSSESQILTDTLSVPPEVDLAGSLARLPVSVLGAGARLQESCAARLGGEFSSFVVTGRGGTPPDPGGWAPDWPRGGDAEPPPRPDPPPGPHPR